MIILSIESVYIPKNVQWGGRNMGKTNKKRVLGRMCIRIYICSNMMERDLDGIELWHHERAYPYPYLSYLLTTSCYGPSTYTLKVWHGRRRRRKSESNSYDISTRGENRTWSQPIRIIRVSYSTIWWREDVPNRVCIESLLLFLRGEKMKKLFGGCRLLCNHRREYRYYKRNE